MLRRTITTVAAGIFLLAMAATAEARTNHALIVGVSEYPGLEEKLWLKGPKNDAVLVRDFLLANPAARFDASRIRVLADGVEAAPEPTLASIREAFAALARDVQAGDFVYLHFSGHGSQAPAGDPASELDGLDELFLPRDIGPWEKSVGTVRNALVDDELGAMIDAIRARGADVFAVFDSCHSGTVTRGAPADDDIIMRKLPGEALGIPQEAIDDAEATVSRAAPGQKPDTPVTLGDGSGGFVAFYAAQTSETTPEMRLPAGKKGRQSHGLFTWTLFETLAQYPGMTYRQLGQEVLRRYATKYMVQPTPLFEGDLDKPVFGTGDAEAIRQWPVTVAGETLSIAAGELQQLGEGEVLALLPSPAARTADAIGHVRIVSSTALDSVAEPVEHGDKPAPELETIAEGHYVRRIAATADFSLTVAMPVAVDGEAAAFAAALPLLEEHAGQGLRATFVGPGEPADIRLAMLSPDAVAEQGGDPSLAGHLWLLPPTGEVAVSGPRKSPSIVIDGKSPDELAEALADNLTRIARATNLLKLGGTYAGAALAVDAGIETRSKVKPDLVALDAASIPALVPGDEVHLRAENRTDGPVDLNVLFVGSDYSISHLFAGRLQPGDTLRKPLGRVNDKSFGRERVVLIMTPAKPQTAVEHLGFLAQDAVPTTREAVRGPATLRAALTEAGFGTVTRGMELIEEDAETGPAGAIVQFEIDTMPER